MGRPRWVIPPTHYAACLKIPVSFKPPHGVNEFNDGARVWVKARANLRQLGDDLYHGVTHVIVERGKVRHNEADVWAVQCELVLPYEVAVRCSNVEQAMHLQPNATRGLLAAILNCAAARFMRLGWRL